MDSHETEKIPDHILLRELTREFKNMNVLWGADKAYIQELEEFRKTILKCTPAEKLAIKKDAKVVGLLEKIKGLEKKNRQQQVTINNLLVKINT